MIISFIKLTHMLFVLLLLGSTLYCGYLACSRKYALATQHYHKKTSRIHDLMIVSVVMALITGSLLVIPKNFTFHTPWIQAAYFFSALFAMGMLVLNRLKKKFPAAQRGIWLAFYIGLAVTLICLIQGAVTKSAFIFN
jgi:hypothetical protein